MEISELKVKLEGHWINVIHALAPGLSEAVVRGKAHQPCPYHGCLDGGGKDRFNFDKDFVNTGQAHCNQKCPLNSGDGIALLQTWNNWTIPEVMKQLTNFLGLDDMPAKYVKKEKLTLKDEDKSDQAKAILRACSGIKFKVGEYLKYRGLGDDVPDCLEYHENLKHWCVDEKVERFEPALVARILGVDGKLKGIHRIYLDTDGPGKAKHLNVKLSKKCEGETLSGGAVHISEPHDDFLFITEGLETALAVHYMTSQGPVWASLSATYMMTMDIPAKIKKVSIFADNDPAGIVGAETLAKKLMKQGIKVTIRLAKPDKDWLDLFLEHGMGTCSHEDNTPAYEVEPDPVAQSLPMLKDQPTEEFKQQDFIENRFFGAYEEEDIELPDPIIEGVINQQEVIVLSGPPKLGKSLLACNLAMCAASGMDWFGFHVPKAMKVLYLQRELGDGWMQTRAKKIFKGYSNQIYVNHLFERAGVQVPGQFDLEAVRNNLSIPRPVNFKIDDDEAWTLIKAQIARDKFDLIIIDPLFCMIKGNENDTKDMTKVLDNLIALKTETGVSVLLIHHFGKSTGTIKGAHAHRGSSVIGGGSDGNITFKTLDPELIVANGLDGKDEEFAIISFEMRNSEPVSDFIMWRNPKHLIWEKAKQGVNKSKPKSTDGTPIVKIMEKLMKATSKADLAMRMVENGWSSESIARRKINEMIKSRLLLTEKMEDHSHGVNLILPEWVV